MKINELIQRIQSLYSKGVESDDSRLTNRHIYNKILSIRTRLISEDRINNRKVSPWNQDTLSCVELESIPAYDCPCILPATCKRVLRSKHRIPKAIEGMITAINSVENSIKIDLVNKNSARYIGGNKYTGSKVNSFIEEDYLYVIKDTSIGVVQMRGVFEDPIQVDLFNALCDATCEDCNCDPVTDKEFSLEAGKVDRLIEMCVRELIEVFRSSLEDLSNDSKDSPIQQSK